MTLLILLTILLGATLERFFKALILVPASMVLFVAAGGKSFYLGHSLLHFALDCGLLTASLQLGYASPLVGAAFASLRQRRNQAPANPRGFAGR